MPDKMIVTKTKLDALATSVSQKTGVAAPLTIAEMKTAVDNLVIPVTTPTYMWKDSNNLVHFSATEHSGYQINVASVEEYHTWLTLWEATISPEAWEDLGHCLGTVINADWSSIYDLDPSQVIFRVTYDGVPHTMIFNIDGGYLGSDVFAWDGESTLEYPFGVYLAGDETYINIVDKTPNVTHVFKVEYEG